MNDKEINVKKLFGNKLEMVRGEIKNDPYFLWYEKNKNSIKDAGGLVNYINPLGSDSEILVQIGDFSLYKCSDTGFIFANPRLTTAASKPFLMSLWPGTLSQLKTLMLKERD
jgi:hypothetical protein